MSWDFFNVASSTLESKLHTNAHTHTNPCMCGHLATKHRNTVYILNWVTDICQNTTPKSLSKGHTQNNCPKALQKDTQGARVNAFVRVQIHTNNHSFYLSIPE